VDRQRASMSDIDIEELLRKELEELEVPIVALQIK
jgi:hypothetical protein